MMKKIILNLLISFFIFSCSQTITNNDNADNKTINWNSESGIKMFERSEYKQDFYELSGFFQPQINPLYCGIASSVIILNATNSNQNIPSQKELEIEKPDIFGGGIIPFKSYSQMSFLNKQTDLVKKKEIISMKNINDKRENIDPGVTLKQLKEILEIHNLEVKKYHVKEYSEQELKLFREKVKKITEDKEKYLLVNFNGKKLGLTTGGHISPLVAYDQKSDSALVMDVAGHKNSWYWVKIKDLLQSMNTKDCDNYRGYLIIKNKSNI